ncbi:SMC-Scp complex subunit ScpB [Mesoplasma photuris]|uniref:SMC-Scp complex subunit ScpB n=1 Tax=Mesoplasma photuris TaxID=217731 RepID=UPI0004E0F192|nr:SMC-Scp complex subunit ScpB [Mesoplasma photuris]
MNREKTKAIIEGLLFLNGDDGISLLDIQTVLEEIKPNDIKTMIDELDQKYANDPESVYSIQTFAKTKFRLQTKSEFHEYFAKLEFTQDQRKLSNSSVEVLSIVAYKGPISKSAIDAIRGTDSSYAVYKLKERNLIRVSGKDDSIGRSNLYSITDNFFKLFNLVGGKEVLPTIDEDELQSMIDDNIEKLEKLDQNTGGDIFDERRKNDISEVDFGEE